MLPLWVSHTTHKLKTTHLEGRLRGDVKWPALHSGVPAHDYSFTFVTMYLGGPPLPGKVQVETGHDPVPGPLFPCLRMEISDPLSIVGCGAVCENIVCVCVYSVHSSWPLGAGHQALW